jgi:uncharacterized protein (DUF2267 family)
LEEQVTASSHDSIDRTVAKTREWIDEMAEELGTDDRHEAYRVLRAFLRIVRDRVGLNEAAQLAAQLPELLRGAYYENWVPSRTPQRYDRDAFLDRLAEEARLAGETEASYAAAAAMTVLRRRVSAGEIEDVLANFPADLRELFEASAPG